MLFGAGFVENIRGKDSGFDFRGCVPAASAPCPILIIIKTWIFQRAFISGCLQRAFISGGLLFCEVFA